MATTNSNFRFPSGSDVPDVPLWNGNLAADVERSTATYSVSHSEAGATSAPTGNLWLTNLVSDVKQGNITFAATGITIAIPGVYEIVHRARMGSTGVAQSQLSIGLGTTILATSFLMFPAAGNLSPTVQYIGTFAAGNVIQFGWNQPTASVVSYTGGATANISTVRLIRAI